jgi:hypothetical protein
MKVYRKYIVAPASILYDSPISQCVYICIATSLLGNGSVKNVFAATNTHVTTEKLLDMQLAMYFVLY